MWQQAYVPLMAPEEDEDDADAARRGDEVDAFGQNVSKIVQ